MQSPTADCPETCSCLCDPCVIFGCAAHHQPDGPDCNCDPCNPRSGSHVKNGSTAERAFDAAMAAAGGYRSPGYDRQLADELAESGMEVDHFEQGERSL